MEFKEDFIKDNELSETQVTALTKATNDNEATLKKEWDGKANENAEGILHGASKAMVTKTGIAHENGVKIVDYLTLALDGSFKGEKATLERKEKELDEKIKGAGTDEVVKAELENAKQKIDDLKKIEAEHSEFIKGDYKNLFEKSNTELSQMKKQVAFGNVKPKFADGVNEYESKAKWNDFTKNVLDKYDIHLDENNEPVFKDKENEYKTGKLSDLVKEDQGIQELVKGRQQLGLGSSTKSNVKIEGVPFEVPENATPKERQNAIKDYIIGTEKIPEYGPGTKYADRFSELNKKIREKTPA
ncbi:MAG: hypothetical protein IID16_01035 [Candidatus Marinimicrobia bacterium]|nr:hypothetical protein [Candidatus Neomarinimicrobiota bacterium]